MARDAADPAAGGGQGSGTPGAQRGGQEGGQGPVWLLRLAFVLFFVAFAGYLGRQAWLVFGQ